VDLDLPAVVARKAEVSRGEKGRGGEGGREGEGGERVSKGAGGLQAGRAAGLEPSSGYPGGLTGYVLHHQPWSGPP
jgi:hypothetical protein